MYKQTSQITPQIFDQIENLAEMLKQQKQVQDKVCIKTLIQGAFLTRVRNNTSHANLEHYKKTFVTLFKHFPIQYVDEYNLQLVRNFVTVRTGKVKKNSIRTEVIDLVAFNNWLIREGYKTKLDHFSYSDTDAPPKSKCKSNTDVVTREQVLTFWNVVVKNRNFQSEYDMRLYQALLGMYLFQVPRLNEARRIYRNKVELSRRIITLHPDCNKGGRPDSIFISKMYYPF